MWRNPIETHVCGRLSGFGGGSGRATDGGCVTERTRFTPAVNGGILSLIKDREGTILVPFASFSVINRGFKPVDDLR